MAAKRAFDSRFCHSRDAPVVCLGRSLEWCCHLSGMRGHCLGMSVVVENSVIGWLC